MRRLAEQAERLIGLGVHEVAGVTAGELRAAAGRGTDGVLVLPHAPASALAPLLEHGGNPGFVVVDMTDVDEFGPVDGLDLPAGPAYAVHGLDRPAQLARRRLGRRAGGAQLIRPRLYAVLTAAARSRTPSLA